MPYMGNKYLATFSCGHKEYIIYHGQANLLNQLAKAEKAGLCSACKEKKLKEENQRFEMPYSVYKEKFKRKRKVVAGAYNNETHTIDVWLPPKLAQEYIAESARILYNIKVIKKINEYEYEVLIFVEKNSFQIKDKLKNIGFRWNNKMWCKPCVVTSYLSQDGINRWIPKTDNNDFYDICNSLEEIGCNAHYHDINWNV